MNDHAQGREDEESLLSLSASWCPLQLCLGGKGIWLSKAIVFDIQNPNYKPVSLVLNERSKAASL